MRYAAVGVLVAAAFGIHCSAPADEAPTETAPSDIVAPAPSHGGKKPAPGLVPEEQSASPFKSSIPGLAALVHAGVAPIVTSTVTDEAGAHYVAGTFMGTIMIGSSTLTSKGEKDVFLLKLDESGGFQWVRAVGSAAGERSPRVTLSIESNRVTLVGLTDGEMDCGAGPMAPWSSETMFVCIFAGNDGVSKGSGVFPTGEP